MKSIFEVQQEGKSIIIWEAGIGHRVVFASEEMANIQAELLQEKERLFHKAKIESGVAVIYVFGEDMTSWEYIQRCLKSWRSGVGQFLSTIVYENLLKRPHEEYW